MHVLVTAIYMSGDAVALAHARTGCRSGVTIKPEYFSYRFKLTSERLTAIRQCGKFGNSFHGNECLNIYLVPYYASSLDGFIPILTSSST
jgi:hypothetical protein